MAFPVDEDQIAAAEAQLGRSLPAGHRARLARNNGGEVVVGGREWTLFPVLDETDRKRSARTANHILWETEQARAWPAFPAQAVAIASNGLGDLLVLLPGADGPQLWRHENGSTEPVEVSWA